MAQWKMYRAKTQKTCIRVLACSLLAVRPLGKPLSSKSAGGTGLSGEVLHKAIVDTA